MEFNFVGGGGQSFYHRLQLCFVLARTQIGEVQAPRGGRIPFAALIVLAQNITVLDIVGVAIADSGK